MNNTICDEFEIKEELPEFSAPYAQVFAPEILDGRLSMGARMLRLWLRFRCRGKYEKNFVKFATLAEDFGVNTSTVRRWAQELEDIGAIKLISRGVLRSCFKVLARPTAVYGEDEVVNAWNYISGDGRCPGKLNHLLCKNERSEDGEVRPLKNERTLERAKTSARRPLKNERSYIDESSYLDEHHIDEKHMPSSPACDPFLSEISSKDQEKTMDSLSITKNDNKNVLSPSPVNTENTPPKKENPAPDLAPAAVTDPRAATAQAIAQTVPAATAVKSEEAIRKMRQGRALKAEQGEAQEAGKKKRREGQFQAKGGGSTKEIEKLFKELSGDYYIGIPVGRWDKKEYKLAKILLEDYGEAAVDKMIRYLFESWDKVRARYPKSDLGPMPSIEVMYGWRKTWFPEQAIKAQKVTQEAERPVKKEPKFF